MNLQHARAVGGARLASAPEARPSARPCTRQPSRRAPLVVSAQRRHVVEAATLVKEERLERPAQHQHLQDPRPADQPPRDAQAAPTTPPPPAGAVVPEWLPKLALLGAAALWGSYAPSVRLLYESAQPPDAAVILAVRGMLQSGALVLASLALQAPSASNNESSSGSSASSGSGSSASSSSGSIASRSSTGDGDVPLLERWLFLRSPPLWMAALELGAWSYSATMLQTFGLQLVGATRASFLVQATVLLTPLLSLAAGYRPGRRVWGACALALVGCLLITTDEASAEAATGLAQSGLHLGGDAAILLSALFYSLMVVRMTGYARSLPAVQIATWKSVVLGSLSLGALGVAAAGVAAQGEQLSALWSGYTDPASWAALGWAGLGPGALASYLHVVGQRHVAPAQAQVIFSSKPLWAAGLAWVLLGGEELGPLTWAGGAALAGAGLVASTAPGEAASPADQKAKRE